MATAIPPIRPFGLSWRSAGLALGLLSAACSPAVPASPAYDTDVRPIFAAHCLRCHGTAFVDGGALNPNVPASDIIRRDGGGAPFYENPDADPLLTTAIDPAGPYHFDLSVFGSTAGCPDSGNRPPAACQFGAKYTATAPGANEASQLYLAIHGGSGGYIAMPPAPAAPLDDWEVKVIDAWIANPVCSNAAQPNPAICPGS